MASKDRLNTSLSRPGLRDEFAEQAKRDGMDRSAVVEMLLEMYVRGDVHIEKKVALVSGEA